MTLRKLTPSLYFFLCGYTLSISMCLHKLMNIHCCVFKILGKRVHTRITFKSLYNVVTLKTKGPRWPCIAHRNIPDRNGVYWPFSSREEVQYRCSRWRPWWPSWISNQNNFSYFRSTSHLHTSNEVSSQLAFWFRRNFQHGC